MKIQKFNESNNYEQEELDNFIELFQNKFFKDKYIKSYSSQSSRKKYINLVLNFANINGKESFFNLQKIYIERLATPEEIENQEIKISALKYNL